MRISKWLENTAVKSLFCLFMSFPQAFLSIPEYYFPAKKQFIHNPHKKTLPCLCFSIVLNLSQGCFLRYKTMNSFPRTFRSNLLKLFRINILFPSFYFFHFFCRNPNIFPILYLPSFFFFSKLRSITGKVHLLI